MVQAIPGRRLGVSSSICGEGGWPGSQSASTVCSGNVNGKGNGFLHGDETFQGRPCMCAGRGDQRIPLDKNTRMDEEKKGVQVCRSLTSTPFREKVGLRVQKRQASRCLILQSHRDMVIRWWGRAGKDCRQETMA